MDVRLESQAGPPVRSPEQVVAQLGEQLRSEQRKWLKELQRKPKGFADLEVAIHQHFQAMADQVVASLLAAGTQDAAELEVEKKSS